MPQKGCSPRRAAEKENCPFPGEWLLLTSVLSAEEWQWWVITQWADSCQSGNMLWPQGTHNETHTGLPVWGHAVTSGDVLWLRAHTGAHTLGWRCCLARAGTIPLRGHSWCLLHLGWCHFHPGRWNISSGGCGTAGQAAHTSNMCYPNMYKKWSSAAAARAPSCPVGRSW